MRKLTIDGKVIQDDSNCYVIAEIGNDGLDGSKRKDRGEHYN